MPQNATVLYRIEAPASLREHVCAELFELGTLGIEERADGEIRAWFHADVASAAALQALTELGREIRVLGPLAVPDIDWEREWRAGLAPRQVGPLWVRPSWCASAGEPEIQIDPKRAFGTGEHPSTRLALLQVLAELRVGDRILDVGTGTGILAIGALRMGAGSAVGIDPDADACENARENSQQTGGHLRLVRGTLDAIAKTARFELVVANLLLSRLLPWIGRVLAHAERVAILSGYLASEAKRVEDEVRRLGWDVRDVREESSPYDESGDERWCACVVIPEGD